MLIHEEVDADLDAIYAVAPIAAARIVALLDELDGNPDLLDRLSQNKFGTPRDGFNVAEWVTGSTPLTRTLPRRLKMGQKECHVQAKKVQ
jgi:hypothetical protein